MTPAEAKAQLKTLEKERTALESEAADIVEKLSRPTDDSAAPGPGLKEKLVDGEGYPRADVDLFDVRALRNRHAVITTDHKALMKKIEALLPI
eukprot:CAMPEP_0119273774 /NCGR_PEP_ID=MMETSP1329-20130426/10950_1 /TAXON_ID=114041 /ORGANISM="Genus nov. species nov., Strain RCC1024" /LENGTH=92 /DNA_ID=CAMNT_0007274015 /DNA_START=177 /DNA_END=452 /DNA_ORIENTATION=-